MRRTSSSNALRVLLAAGLALPLLGAGRAAARADTGVVVAGALAAASPQQIAQDLKAARTAVDAALARRQQRLGQLQQATAARDAAAAQVALLKRQGAVGPALEDALRRALAKDEEAAVARSELMAAEADVAKGGAVVLRLYDALIIEQKRTLSSLSQSDGARPSALAIYQALVDSRDAVRRVLLPVLAPAGSQAALSAAAAPIESVQIAARPDDDIETLMEKADLARDLEERYLRRAQAVRTRILELQEEQAVAQDVTGMVRQGSLFDEEDRRLVVVRDDLLPAPPVARIDVGGGSTANDRTSAVGGGAGAPPAISAPPPEPAGDSAGGADPAAPPAGFGPATGGDTESADSDDQQRTLGDAPPPVLATPSAPTPVFSRTEQGVLAQGRGADAYIAGVIASGSLSVDELRAMEKKLAAEAKKMRAQAKKLREQAQDRAK